MALHLSVIGNFFHDIKQFFVYRDIIGVDIGTVAIKLAHLSRRGEQIVLGNYGILETKEYLERGNAAIQTSSLKLVERDAVALLKILVREVQPTTTSAVASIPIFGVFVVPIEVPLLPPNELAKLISFQARQYIPLPIEQVSLEWTKVDEFDNQRGIRYQRLILTAIPISIVKTYQAIFRAAGLKLIGLEIENQALARALFKTTDPATIILDIGAESTSISIVDKGSVKQTGQTDYGGLALTQAVARSLGVSFWRAEELKRRRGLLGQTGEYDLSTSLGPFLDVIIQECGRVKTAYERMYHSTVERVMLVGGGANLPGIQDYIAAQTQLSIVPPEPFTHVKYPAELEPAMKFLKNEFAVALGLAMKFYTQQRALD